MSFSSLAARAATLLILAGCAHARPSPSQDAPSAPATHRARGTAPGSQSGATPSAQPQASPGGGVEGRLDPSEEITPAELARIPDPVHGASGVAEAPTDRASKALPSASEAPPAGGGTSGTTGLDSSLQEPPPGQAGPWTWRVQILATPDRALASRVGREASERLGTTFRVDLESGLSKVRLGAFATEADAQALKARAVELGYSGAFRVKIRTPRTDG